MDNLSAHLDGRVKPLVESKRAKVLYLPAYWTAHSRIAGRLAGKLVKMLKNPYKIGVDARLGYL